MNASHFSEVSATTHDSGLHTGAVSLNAVVRGNRTLRAFWPPVLGAVTAAALGGVPYPMQAQDHYPTKLIKIIVPFSAGTSVDLLPRLVAEKLSSRWGQPVIIENRAGASGNIGAEAVARADADGYALLASPAPPLVINQYL